MKKSLSFVFIWTLLATCKQGEEFIPSQYAQMVFYADTVLKSTQRVAPEADIFISNNAEADPFFTKGKADKEGEFSIDFVPNINNLCVVGKWKDSRGVLFQGYKKYESNEDLMLYPRYLGGKIKVTVKDASMQPVNGVDVFLFVNNTLAGSVAAGEAKGFIKKETTNESGIAFFYDLVPKTYYVAGRREKQVFDVKNTETKVSFNDYKTINELPVTLTTPALAAVKLTITVQDAAQKPMFGSEVLVFTNAAQAETALSAKKPTGVVESQLTDAKGQAFFRTLADNADYFVVARDSLYDAPTQKLRAAFSSVTPLKTTATSTITIR
ncbi:MAG: hypothetical protein R2822_05210 [Spirosomataceae bacterium]